MVKNDTKLNDEIVGYQQYLYDSIENCWGNIKDVQNVRVSSHFITKNAKEIVSKLVTVFEGEPYSCLDINYESKLEPPERVLLITKGRYEEPKHAEFTGTYNWYHDDYDDPIKDRVRSGNSFVLARGRYTFVGGVINLYSDNLYSDIEYGRFTYVKEFFDFVIGYRLKNGKTKEEIHEELPKLLGMFAKNNRELIEKNYHKRNRERLKSYKLFLREEKASMSKQIDEVLEELDKKE